MFKRISSLTCAVLFMASAATAQIPYDRCGELFQAVTCVMFMDDDGRELLLDDNGGMPIGVRFRVQGDFDPGCFTICNQGNGCIFNTVISSCGGGGMDFTDVCNGDGGDQMGCTDCPCANNSTPGTIGGCINSAGTSTRLLPSGTDSISSADLRMEASGAPPNNSAVLTSGDALAPANMANPCFGLNTGIQSVSLDGLRCAVQNVLRHGVRPSDANGDIGVTTNGWGQPNGFFNFAAFMVGDTKHFQIIHRDDAMAVCQTGQNTSQAVTVNFSM